MLTFAHEWALWLAPLPLVLSRLLPVYREGRPAARIPAFARLDALGAGARGPAAGTRRRGALLAGLQVVAWIGLLTALARPGWLGPPVVRTLATRDLLLAVDLSGSMETRDFTTADGRSVDRLTAVKEVLGEFLTDREGDRVGVIVFGSRAYVQVPLTRDLAIARRMLDETVPRMAGARTALGDAIGLAITLFERSDMEDRVLIALTDGNDTGSRIPPVAAARVAHDRGITIHTVVVGDPTSAGEKALDEEALREVARQAGGRYFFAADRDALGQIYRELDRLETRAVETISYRPVRELYPWPLGISLLVFLGYHGVQALRAWPRLRASPTGATRPT